MIKTSYQVPEIRNANDEVVQEGAFGKNTALSNSENTGWIDYVMNDLEALHDTIGDSAATLDGNGHVVEPANLAIGDEDGNRLKTSYLKLTGGTVAGTVNIAQNLKMQDNQENVFGGLFVPSSSSSSQYLAMYGGESPSSNDYASALFLYPVGDGRFILRSKSTDNSTSYELVGGSDGTLKWRGNTLAPLASPAFTGNPTATTQATTNSSTRLATTAYVKNNITANLFQLSNADTTAIQSGDDLDDYTTAGTYTCASSTIASSLSNCPHTSSGFKMIVMATTSTTYMYQVLIAYNRYMFCRGYTGSSWNVWKKIALAEDVLALSGGTLTGNLAVQMVNPSSYGTAYEVKYTGIEKGTSPASQRYGSLIRCVDSDNEVIAGLQYSISSAGISEARIFNNWHTTSYLRLYSTSSGQSVLMNVDNSVNLGNANFRWKQLFAGTTTISTSDERLKENIAPIDDDVLDAWGDVGWVQYQFKESVEEKGETNARLHTGAIAQRIESIFASHGLDANRYGLLCYDEWDATPAERDEQGNITEPAKPAGNRYSLRYEEALCMEAAFQRRRADRLEERIARLEALVSGQE